MYTQKLSEQGALIKGGSWSSFSDSTKTITLTTVDMRDYHRIRPAYFLAVTSTTSATTGDAATATAKATIKSIVVQASSSSAFGGTATTVTSSTSSSTLSEKSTIGTSTKATVTATASGIRSIEVSGEEVQDARATEDRYIRAKIKIKSASATDNVRVIGAYEKAQSRYPPA